MTHVDLSGDLHGEDSSYGERSFRLRIDAQLNDPVWLSDSTFLAAAMFEDARLLVFDTAGRSIRRLGEPPPGPGEIPAIVRAQAYQGRMAVNRAREVAAVAARHAGSLELYDFRGVSVGEADVPISFSPVYTASRRQNRPWLSLTDDTRIGYVSIASTDDRIYALFTGRTLGGFGGTEAVYGQHVHVFDWSGELHAVLQLPREAIEIAVDEQSLTLYTASHDPSPAIVAYSLDQVRLVGLDP